jgi:hypothetical protein
MEECRRAGRGGLGDKGNVGWGGGSGWNINKRAGKGY